jgi:hypothetical protein
VAPDHPRPGDPSIASQPAARTPGRARSGTASPDPSPDTARRSARAPATSTPAAPACRARWSSAPHRGRATEAAIVAQEANMAAPGDLQNLKCASRIAPERFDGGEDLRFGGELPHVVRGWIRPTDGLEMRQGLLRVAESCQNGSGTSQHFTGVGQPQSLGHAGSCLLRIAEFRFDAGSAQRSLGRCRRLVSLQVQRTRPSAKFAGSPKLSLKRDHSRSSCLRATSPCRNAIR